MSRQTAILTLLLLALCVRPQAQRSSRETIRFDAGWKFHRGGAQRAEQPGFDDRSWRSVDLPHDWSLEDLPGTGTPFDRDAPGQVGTGFTVGGPGWYRKAFSLADADQGRRIIVQFDGVYMNAEVFVNGESLGSHPYGYTSFWYDVTDKVRIPGDNLLAVNVRNAGENSRWYSGSGIYRHVWLKKTDPVHVAQWGTSISTADVSAASARVTVRTRVQNQSGRTAAVTLTTRLTAPGGGEAGAASAQQTLAGGAEATFVQDIVVRNPALWALDAPAMYTATSQVSSATGDRLDEVSSTFGIRTISYDVAGGFRLNGRPMKLQGGCVHHDNGPLGARAYDRAEERRVELLKASGFNAIRCAHNPPSPAFLDACDRLGVLVIDEAFDMWDEGKNPHDYHLFFEQQWKSDLGAMIARDRNHPSIIAWSIGNEIPGMDKSTTAETAKTLAAYVHDADASRPVLAAVNDLNPKKDPYMAALDVAGYNYGTNGQNGRRIPIFETDHARVPSRIMVQTESYPLDAFQSWMDVLDHPYLIGDFVWTAFDYIGESSIGWRGYWQDQSFYPWTLAFTGDIDIAGWKRPQSYYRDALWKANQISLFVTPPVPSFPPNPAREAWSRWHWFDAVADWNWTGYEGRPLAVNVYSSFDEAELFLNGQSLGRRKTDRSTEFKAEWSVPYAAGELRAVGYTSGRAAGAAVLTTARKVSQLTLTPDRPRIDADAEDLSYVTVELTDASGVRNPKAENLLRFAIDGPGTIVAVANANPMSVESYTRPERHAWRGRALVVVKAGERAGDVHLRVSSAGLPTATTAIEVR